MAETELIVIYLAKAEESLAGAESEFGNRRYNNTANRAYYACFQAAIAAILREGLSARAGQWGHDYVPAQFNGELISRRHRYSTDLRGVLERNYILRQSADYDGEHVSQTQADRALGRTRLFVEAVQHGGGETA